jgi:flagellar FliJ protein
MARFEFSLEAVLTQRRFIERERQRALAELLGRMHEMERQLQAMDQEVKSATADLRHHHLTGNVNVAFIAGHRRFVLAVERRAGAIIQKMALLQREIDRARQLLILAARDLKVVEKLRQRRLDEWRAAVAAAEQREIDDVGARLTVMQWSTEESPGETV